MSPLYPYMFKAFYDWLLDSNGNPRLLVDASQPNVQVPREYVDRDVILISIHPKFINELNIGPTTISFYTKFRGKREFVVIPYYAMNELLCPDSGLTIPLNMWLTSIEMASHPGGVEALASSMVQATEPSTSSSSSSTNKLSAAGKKISFSEVIPTDTAVKSEPFKKSVVQEQDNKNRPTFSLV